MLKKRETIVATTQTIYLDEEDSPTLDISTTNLRYLLLIFAVFLCFGSYYVYGSPSALQSQLEDWMDLSAFEYNLLFTVYAIPNCVLPFFGGFLLEHIGLRKSIMIYSILIVAGQSLFAFAVSIKNFYLALVGRFVFGLGGENLNVAQTTVISSWFRGKALSFGIGLAICVSRLGSVLNDFTQPEMDNVTGSPVFGLWMGSLVCIAALLSGIGVNWLDYKREQRMGKTEFNEKPKIALSDIFKFGTCFWLIAVNSIAMYTLIIAFTDNGTQFFQERYNYNLVESGFIVGITYIVAALFCPLVGLGVDYIGKRTMFIILSAAMGTVVHCIFIILPDCDQCFWGIFNMILLGLSYAFYASTLWACIPYSVPENAAGTALGLVTACVNIGIGVGPLVVGLLKESTSLEHGYFYMGVFFIGLGTIGMITGVALTIADQRKGGNLNSVCPQQVYLVAKDTDVSLNYFPGQ